MLPTRHILLGAIFSLILVYFFNLSYFEASLVFLSSFLIDADHYIWWVLKKKDISFSKAYHWLKNLPKNHKLRVDISHTFEFLLFIGILSYFSKFFVFILIGLLFHSISDIINMLPEIADSKKCSREYFLIRYLLTKDKKKYL